MEMEEEGGCRAHVLFLPVPVQGHINPMLNFSKRLASKGVKSTLVLPLSISRSIEVDNSMITVEPHSDYSDEGGFGMAAYMAHFEEVVSKEVSKLLETPKFPECPVKCLVYSSVMPLALNIAKRHGLIGASFFTQSCAVNVLYYHVFRGLLSVPLQEPTVSLPGLPLLDSTRDLPSFLTVKESHQLTLRLLMDQFPKVGETDWLLFNTCDVLEDEARNWLAKQWAEKMISVGPTIVSIYFKNGPMQLESDLSPSIKWLNTKETGSVVYVSFGSNVKLGEDQIEELAWGLEMCCRCFLWVVRAEEHHKLPSKFKDGGMSGKGLVVPWCSQLQVLSHEAVGCFVTHCGWNSTVEALSLGVPMVAMPQRVDQPTDAKLIEDVWKVGVRVNKDAEGIVTREEIAKCIDDVMGGGLRGAAMKMNALRWKQLAEEALGEGGSSDRNIDKFIAGICVTCRSSGTVHSDGR